MSPIPLWRLPRKPAQGCGVMLMLGDEQRHEYVHIEKPDHAAS
jgi:hypothetical protein